MGNKSSLPLEDVVSLIPYREFPLKIIPLTSTAILRALSKSLPNQITISWIQAVQERCEDQERDAWYLPSESRRERSILKHFVDEYPRFLEQYILVGGSPDAFTQKSRGRSPRIPSNHNTLRICHQDWKNHRAPSSPEDWWRRYPEYAVILRKISFGDRIHTGNKEQIARMAASSLAVSSGLLTPESITKMVSSFRTARVQIAGSSIEKIFTDRCFRGGVSVILTGDFNSVVWDEFFGCFMDRAPGITDLIRDFGEECRLAFSDPVLFNHLNCVPLETTYSFEEKVDISRRILSNKNLYRKRVNKTNLEKISRFRDSFSYETRLEITDQAFLEYPVLDLVCYEKDGVIIIAPRGHHIDPNMYDRTDLDVTISPVLKIDACPALALLQKLTSKEYLGRSSFFNS